MPVARTVRYYYIFELSLSKLAVTRFLWPAIFFLSSFKLNVELIKIAIQKTFRMAATEGKKALLDQDASSGQDTPDLVIPEARDGFFGYNEEKHFQHVRDFNCA